MSTKKLFLQIYFIFIVTLILISSQNIITLPSVVLDALILIFLILSKNKNRGLIIPLSGKEGMVTKWFIIPFCLIFLYSMIIQFCNNFTNDYLIHTFTLCYRMILYILLAKVACENFKENTVKYLLYTCIICYIPAILKHFILYGLLRGIVIIFNSNANKVGLELEVNKLTYIFGFICIYYFYLWRKNKKEDNYRTYRRYFFISLIMMLIGVKRIAIVATFVAILLIIFLNRFSEKNQYRLICTMSLAMVIFAFVYVIWIKNGFFETLLNKYQIDSMFRFNFWNYFQNRYEINPTFLGNGISFSHRVMQHEFSYIQDLRSAVNIHNDVIGIYMGLGFWGFLLYWICFFYGRVQSIKKETYSYEIAIFSFIISLYYFITFMVANGGLVEFDHSIYFLMIYSMFYMKFYKPNNIIEKKREVSI